MPPWRREWVDRKLDIARRLANPEIGGGYGEAILIISAAISSMAAEAWPGKGIDKKRFIEFLIRLTDTSFGMKNISVPLFVFHNVACSHSEEISSVSARLNLYDTTRVLTSDDIDLDDAVVTSECSRLAINEIRYFSYASLFYTEVRSGYTHEYTPTWRADSIPMTRSTGVSASYVNLINQTTRTLYRKIYFHLDWLLDVTCSVASRLDSMESSIPFNRPSCWWIDER